MKNKGEREKEKIKKLCFFEAYANRITDINQKAQQKNICIQKRFQVKNTEMKMTTVNKVQFGSLNGKQFYHS